MTLKKKKEGNVEMLLRCEELGIELRALVFSKDVEKLIEREKGKAGKARINENSSAFLLCMLELWEQELLVVPGANGIEALGKFIYDHFLLPRKNDVDKFLSLASIKSKLYELKG